MMHYRDYTVFLTKFDFHDLLFIQHPAQIHKTRMKHVKLSCYEK